MPEFLNVTLEQFPDGTAIVCGETSKIYRKDNNSQGWVEKERPDVSIDAGMPGITEDTFALGSRAIFPGNVACYVKHASGWLHVDPTPEAFAVADQAQIMDVDVQYEILGVLSPEPPSTGSVSTNAVATRVNVLSQHSYEEGINQRICGNQATPTCTYGPFGYSLARILREDFGDMPNSDDFAFPERAVGRKLSVRFKFEEYPQQPLGENTQINALTKRGTDLLQPNKARIARICAKGFQSYLEHCEKIGKPIPYKWEQFVLLDSKLVSRGSIQPEIGVLIRMDAIGTDANA